MSILIADQHAIETYYLETMHHLFQKKNIASNYGNKKGILFLFLKNTFHPNF